MPYTAPGSRHIAVPWRAGEIWEFLGKSLKNKLGLQLQLASHLQANASQNKWTGNCRVLRKPRITLCQLLASLKNVSE